MKTKACAFHIYDEEANAAKEKKAEDEMKAQEEKRNKVPSKIKNGAAKKDVYGVATKLEADRLRLHWGSLTLDYKTKCYEIYKKDEHPTKQQYTEWKSMDQTGRKNEVLDVWPSLDDDMKACVIHIADEETEMGEKIMF